MTTAPVLCRTGSCMRAGCALGGGGSRIPDARRHTVAFLDKARAEHNPTVSERVRDLTTPVVGELVTDACKCAPGPVPMEPRISTGSVDIVVRDSDPSLPEARPDPTRPDPGRVSRHGMEIIKAVAEELFVEQEPVGKRVPASPWPTRRRQYRPRPEPTRRPTRFDTDVRLAARKRPPPSASAALCKPDGVGDRFRLTGSGDELGVVRTAPASSASTDDLARRP
ncbi:MULTISPECIES: ATP-binding protein [unclassified Streptomyces]|uniref:ATP-binding protein n=1 Tax=unclassified Streptomyces TaxID=2593676 RepID=UPI0037F8F183